MAASVAGKCASASCTVAATRIQRIFNIGYPRSCTFLQTRNYAARKGTREKARKKKVKVVVEKVGFIPHNKRDVDMTILPLSQVRKDNPLKCDPPEDDVWIGKYHKYKIFPLAEAIECHKETHGMGMLDAPEAFIKAAIELDMTGVKPSRPVKSFNKITAMPHPFVHGENRTVVAFCDTSEMQESAKRAGATLVGGADLVQRIQIGEVSMTDYNYIVAHPNVMADLLTIKGLLRKKFPVAANGSLGTDIPGMVTKCLHGIKYAGQPHPKQPLYGLCEIIFGRLNMETKHLEENFAAAINDLNSLRPKRPGPFIWSVRVTTDLMDEELKVDHDLYIVDESKPNDYESDDGEDESAAVAL